MAAYLLGIDNGGTISKAALFDLHGKQIASVGRKVATTYPRPGYVERSMPEVWQTTVEAIRSLLADTGIAPSEIAAVGCTGHGNGLYLLDQHGEPLRNGILSVDSRAAALVDEWAAAGILGRVWHPLYQQTWAGQVAPLLAWLKRHEPETMARLGHVLLCKDYIKYKLTGTLNSDHMDMSCGSVYDLNARQYALDTLEAFGIADYLPTFPELVESTQIIGRVTDSAARLTGLQAGTPVAAGIFDVSACALSAGALEPGQACIVAGTWGINSVVTAGVVDNRDLFMNSAYLSNANLLLEASPTSASNLEWYVTELCAAEREQARERGLSVYEVCNEIVERTPQTSVLFHPFLFGSNVGGAARAGFYGVGAWHTRDHLLRAVYEGVVYTHASHIAKLRGADVPILSARLTGGGARSRVWGQMFADVLEMPMEVVTGEEMGARGAAMCAGIGAGVYRDYADAAAQVVQVERRYTPNADTQAYYQARARLHGRLSGVLREAWVEMAALDG